LKGTRVSGSGYNEVLALKMLNVVDYVERGRCAKLLDSTSAPHPVIAALSFRACLRACMRTSTCACVWTCMHTYAQVCMCACTYICACARVRVHAHAYACACMCPRMHRWGVLVAAPRCVRRCLGRAYAPMCMCMHVHAYMHGRVCSQPAVSVTCTLKQVFWAPVHGRVCTFHRCVSPNVHICDALTVGCARVCVCIYVCTWMRVCTDACMRL